MVTKIYETYDEFLNRPESEIDYNGVSPDFPKEYSNWEEMNKTNTGCWNCANCKDCNNCENCENCWNCDECLDCTKCDGCVNSELSSNCVYLYYSYGQ